jgi:hypothetical protein
VTQWRWDEVATTCAEGDGDGQRNTTATGGRRQCAVEQRQGKRKREEEGCGLAGFGRKGLKKTGLAGKMLGGLRRFKARLNRKVFDFKLFN